MCFSPMAELFHANTEAEPTKRNLFSSLATAPQNLVLYRIIWSFGWLWLRW
jgi:hypothetical protein